MSLWFIFQKNYKRTMKNHPNFAFPPIRPIGHYIVSIELHHLIPQSFASSYLIQSGKKVSILHEVVGTHGEPQSAVIVYPRYKAILADDEKTTRNHVSLASLQLVIQQLPIWSLTMRGDHCHNNTLYKYLII